MSNYTNSNVVFYKKNKPKSINLVMIVQNSIIGNSFQYVDVGKSKMKVPTIILKGSHSQYIKKDAFNLISQLISDSQQKMFQQQMIQQNNYKMQALNFWRMKMQSQAPAKKRFNTLEYSGTEMSASSDSYTSVREDDNTAFPQSFVGLSRDQNGSIQYDANKICTAPGGKDTDALKSKQMLENMKKVEASRKEQDKYMEQKNNDMKQKRIDLFKLDQLSTSSNYGYDTQPYHDTPSNQKFYNSTAPTPNQKNNTTKSGFLKQGVVKSSVGNNTKKGYILKK